MAEPAVAEGRVTWEGLARAVNALMLERGEWCGTPMPVEGLRLDVEDRNPYAGQIQALQAVVDGDAPSCACAPDAMDAQVVNAWYSRALRREVIVCRRADGRSFAVLGEHDTSQKFNALVGCMRVSSVWSVAAEAAACARLAALLPKHLMKSYMLAGSFVETSRRSGVTYIFRRCRPTLATRPGPGGEMRFLAALCLHPIGYYAGTWAGSMAPTDEVVAHLLLMRGDERLFWRRANQHGPESPLAGL